MSQGDLAKAGGLDRNTIARLEQGRVKDLSGETVVRVARALHVSTDIVLGAVPLDDTAGDILPAVEALVGA
jgi:transcriptional regulator with XRE-family HTH domain